MTVQLDEDLLHLARRPLRSDGLTEEECIAINLFWRKRVRIPILAKVFQCSKNTIYYNCLTGDAPSYRANGRGVEVNELIDRMGEDKAWAKYVTPEMIASINAENKQFVKTKRLPSAA